MKKIIIYLLTTICTFTTAFCTVNAATKEEAQALLDIVSTDKINDNLYEAKLPMIDPIKSISEDMCHFDRSEIILECSYMLDKDPKDVTEEEANNYEKDREKYCINSKYEGAFYVYLKSLGYDYTKMNFGVEKLEDTVRIYASYDDEQGNDNLEREYKVTYKEDYDTTTANRIKEIASNIKDNYAIYGLNTINSVYHYGDESENIKNNNYIFYRYPELRNVMENNPDFEMQLVLQGAGGTPWMRGNHAYFGIFKDGVLYNTVETNFELNFIIFVDKNLPGTPHEKAIKRINEYFENSAVVKLENIIEEYNDESINNEVNSILGKTEGQYTGYFDEISINDLSQSILVVEVEKDELDKAIAKARDKETGVNIETGSYDVPIDVTINVSDVMNEEYVEKVIKSNDLDLLNAYNIDLIKTGLDTKISNIKNGVTVYIPIEIGNEGDDVNIYYIKEDGSVGEKISGTIVKENDELYASFTTNHFSTYAIENQTTKVLNPETSDNILFYIVIGLISISFLSIITLKNKFMLNLNK